MKAEYSMDIDRTARLREQPRLTAGEMELAQRHTYAFFRLRPCPFTTFEIVYALFDDLAHPLDHNVVVPAGSAPEVEEEADLRAFAEWATSDAPEFLRAEAGGEGSGREGGRPWRS